MIKVLSNSSAAAWAQVRGTFFGKPPRFCGLSDFDVLESGWKTDDLDTRAFSVFVLKRWKEWEVARSRAVQQRQAEERNQREKRAELARWLDETGLAQYGPELAKQDVDIETLQYLTDEDLEAMGILSLGDRRKFVAAARTQVQSKAMLERLQELEAENTRLQSKATQELSQVANAKHDVDSARSMCQQMEHELTVERGHVLDLEKQLGRLQSELRDERTHADEWKRRAHAFAADSEALQARLQQVNAQQRSSIKSCHTELEGKISGILHRSTSGADAQRSSSSSGAAASRLPTLESHDAYWGTGLYKHEPSAS